MNLKLFKEDIRGKKVAVLGIGISNRPLIRYIHGLDTEITAFDRADANSDYISQIKNEFEKDGIILSWSLGDDYLAGLKENFAYIFKTPIVRKDLPEIQDAVRRGAVLTSEMEVFFDCCPCKIIGITGSDGKTTTSTMMAKALEIAGHKVHLGGNIGRPLIDRMEDMEAGDYAVVELSSFQLHTMKKAPHIAVITNISPNHLDVHKDYEEYVEAKMNIFLTQSEDDILVLFKEDPLLKDFARDIVKLKKSGTRGPQVRLFGSEGDKSSYDSQYFYFSDDSKLALSEIKLKGRHNINNFSAVAAALDGICPSKALMELMKTFSGVEHRNEYIRTLDGVDYYNSSIDSSPTRTKATLQAFIDSGREIVLIAGGKDKNSDYGGLGAQIALTAKTLVLCGENSALIRESLEEEAGDRVEIFEAEDYGKALQIAVREAKSGMAVLLSPAGTSFDNFRNFEERGELFKNLVNSL